MIGHSTWFLRECRRPLFQCRCGLLLLRKVMDRGMDCTLAEMDEELTAVQSLVERGS